MMTSVGFTREEIKNMGDPQLPDFMNTVLWAEYSSLGVSPQDMSENWHRYRGDGGIDHGGSLNLEVDVTESSWIPSSDTVWQYKAGSSFGVGSVKNELLKESHEPMRERIRDGATYVLVVPHWDQEKRQDGKDKAVEVFRELFGEGFPNDRVVVYTAPQISEWSYERPHIAIRFGKSPGRLKPLGNMYFPRLSEGRSGKEITFVVNTRQEALERIRLKAKEGRGILEVNGGPGLGKSRIVYEALNTNGFRERSILATDPEAINESASLVHQLQEDTTKGAIIVVDGLTHEGARNLISWVHPLEQGNLLILITVVAPGSLASTVTPEPLVLDILEDTELAEMLTQITGQPQSVTNRIAGLLGGSPSLAVTVGDILTQGSVDWSTLVTDQGLRNHVSDYFQEPLNSALRVVSLVPRVDTIQDSFAHQLCVQLGLNWAQFIDSLQHAANIGVLDSIRGFYFFRSPLLGNWFAGEAWTNWKSQVESLYESHEAFRDALIDVVSTLPHVEAAKEFAYKVGKQDFLEASISGFNENKAHRLAVLSTGYPEIGLETASVAIDNATEEELVSFVDGRQTLISMLIEIVWNNPSKFTTVTPIMNRLAETDRTTLSNNAFGTWPQMFQVYTGPGGAADSANRIQSAVELLDQESASVQKLAINAAKACLRFEEVGPVRPSGKRKFTWLRASPKVIPEEGPAADARNIAIGILKDGLSSSIDVVAEAAWEGIHAVAWDLMALGRLDEFLDVISDPSNAPRSLSRDKAVFSVQNTLQIIRYSVIKKERAADYLRRMDDIVALWRPESVHEKLRRYAGEWLHEDWTESQNPESLFSVQLESLVDEVISTPTSLSEEISWLLGPEVPHALDLGRAFGRKDYDHKLTGIIFDNLSEGCNPDLPTGYLAGIFQKDEDFVCSVIEQHIHSTVGAEIVAGLVRLVTVNTRIVDLLIDVIGAGLMTERAWFPLGTGTWHTAIDRERAKRLVEVTLDQLQQAKSPRAVELVLYIIFNRVAESAENEEEWEDTFYLATDILSESTGIASYYWSQLAKRYMKMNPSRAIDAILRLILESNTRIDLHPYGEELLSTALAEYPILFLDATHEAIQGPRGYAVDIWLQFNHLNLEGVDADSIFRWVRDKGPNGARFIGQFVKPSGDPLSEPAATLIVDYGDDSVVSRVLESNLRPNSWSGPYSSILKGVKETVEPWKRDSQSRIREWATGVIQRLGQDIAREEERERLEDLFGR